MQLRTLGFHPNTSPMEDILFPRNPNTPGQRLMDPGAVNVFNSMSSAMGKLYQELFRDEEVVVRRREMIRKRTEECVQNCGAFPPGTQVVIFGSSANGFGSPKSDIDMCLQLPDGMKLDEQDISGSSAMSKLAEYLEQSGKMTDVDAARLAARIPIIMYRCPDPLPSAEGDAESVECDLSMHNPLAVLNTSLLRTYAEITPITRVLSSIIKRWAKARDINNPARHTLSSYGYIVMLLHYLTFHKRSGNGLVSPVAPADGNPSHRHPAAQRPNPLLPNLQWVDRAWPSQPQGTPYREMLSIPRYIAQHPLEENKRVNTHFFKPSTPADSLHWSGPITCDSADFILPILCLRI
jgi:predicted nucleotidyltransferase